jgi:hypothetical protein
MTVRQPIALIGALCLQTLGAGTSLEGLRVDCVSFAGVKLHHDHVRVGYK